MRVTRNIEGGMRDYNSLAESGCSHFSWWDAGFKLSTPGLG